MKKVILVLAVQLLSFASAVESNIHMQNKEQSQKTAISYGKVLQVTPFMGYKYLKVDENGMQHWMAIAKEVIASGKITTDKYFRYGSLYRVIMEDATFGLVI